MTVHVSVLALSMALAASALPDNGEFGAGTHRFQVERITGGDLVRLADGVEPASMQISSPDGLVIDGGRFHTAQPADLVHGIELGRGKSIALYNKVHPDPAGAEAAGERPGGGYRLFTEAQVRKIFARGDQSRIRRAFTSADANGIPPEPLSETAVLAALSAANNVLRARTQTAWQLTADTGDVVVNGGVFDFHSVNQNLVAARTGTLIWNGGDLTSQGGGGETTLQGTAGIELLGGRIISAGAVDGAISPIHYDPRQRLERDRWTLGKYLALATDGDIDIGRNGQPGPDVRVSDGMLQIGRASQTDGDATPARQHLNLRSGSISLQGEHRSTLLALARGFDIVTVINGGTLNVASAQMLIDTPTESPSLWNMQTIMEAGAINLDNSQLVGVDSAIRGGTVNLTGVSAIYSPMKNLTVSGGTFNVGPQSFIGAIKGDSKARSPYPTAQQDLTISGGTLNFRVVAPQAGEPMIVGTHIGGIFAGDNNPARQSGPTLSIGADTWINVDSSALSPGEYRIADFASVDDSDGKLAIATALPVHDPAGAAIGVLNIDGSLSLHVR